MRIINAIALILGLASQAFCDNYYSLFKSTTTGKSTMNVSGVVNVAATASTPNTPTIILNGATGNVSATTFTGTLSGSASNLTGGLAGQSPVQSAANTTTFLPQMAAGGLIIGSSVGVIPSTGTLTGTASEIGITNASGKITLGGAGQNLGACAANQYAGGATWNHGIQTGGVCTVAGTGDVGQAASNSMSGQTTFLVNSTITFNQSFSVSLSTVTIGQHVVSTGTSIVQVSTSPVNIKTLTFAGFDANAHYRIDISSITGIGTGSATFLALTLNGDIGTNYAYVVASLNAGANSPVAASAVSFCLMADNSGIGGPTAGRSGFGTIDFYTGTPSSSQPALIKFDNVQHDATNSRYQEDYGFCTWSTATAITQVSIFYTAGGSFSGVFNVFRID